MSQDTRWVQRYGSFRQAFVRLKEAMEKKELSELEQNGLVQRFIFTIALGWKVMKDFLLEKGFSFKLSPKDTLREAASAGYIDYAQPLIDGLDIRNELSHDYSGEKFEQSEKEIRLYIYPAIMKLDNFFSEQTQLQ